MLDSLAAHPDAAIQTIFRASLESLAHLHGHADEVAAGLEAGTTPGDSRGLLPQDYEQMYAVAWSLCKAGDFLRALPISVALAAHHCRDARYFFLAGSCLQRAGENDLAVPMYAQALELDGSNAVAAYRLGECLQALHKPAEARTYFSMAVELGHANDVARPIQDMALSRIHSLN